MRGIKPNNYSTEEQNIAEVGDAIAHPIRKRIIDLLNEEPGLTQQYLNQVLPLSQSSISQHLFKLKELDVIRWDYRTHFFPLSINKNKLRELRDYLNRVLDDE